MRITGVFQDGIAEFLRDLSYGKGRTQSLKGEGFPKVGWVFISFGHGNSKRIGPIFFQHLVWV